MTAETRYHRMPGCTGQWVRERCRALEVERCLRCHTRHLVPDRATDPRPAMLTLEEAIPLLCA